jgi:hypothetical protein
VRLVIVGTSRVNYLLPLVVRSWIAAPIDERNFRRRVNCLPNNASPALKSI